MQDGNHAILVPNRLPKQRAQVRLLPQVRAAFPCAARDTSEAAARQVSAGSKRGACSRAFTLLFRTRCICCALHGVFCTSCIARVLRMLR